MWTDYIGYMAALCTTLAFVPQVIHTVRTRDTRAISLGMYVVFVTGVALWLAYGLVIGDGPIVAANAVTLALAASVLAMKLRHR